MIGPIDTFSRPNTRLMETMQAARESSALLSTLPGPNLSFFQPPALPPFAQREKALAAPAFGPGAYSPARLSVGLLETQQTGREASTLLSALMGPNERAFRAPVPPLFAQQRPSAAGYALPRSGAPLLEEELQGRVTSTLLSGLMGAPRGSGPSAFSPFATPTLGTVSGNSLAGLRTAEEIIQVLGSAPPSPLNWRIASDAYQMEAQAQRDLERQQAAGSVRRGEWFA